MSFQASEDGDSRENFISHLSEDIWLLGQDSNKGPCEYKVGIHCDAYFMLGASNSCKYERLVRHLYLMV